MKRLFLKLVRWMLYADWREAIRRKDLLTLEDIEYQIDMIDMLLDPSRREAGTQ